MSGLRSLDTPARFAVTLVVALLASASASRAQDRGICVAATVPEAFRLPDGSEHAAGRLTLCAISAFTPAVELHSVRVDGAGASFALSKKAAPEEYASTRSTVLFRRAPDGALDLVGYVVPCGGKAWSYTMRPSTRQDLAGLQPLIGRQSPGDAVPFEADKGERKG